MIEKRRVNLIAVPPPHLIAWEITRRCNLFCAHCRASAQDSPYEGELTTSEMLSVIDDIGEMGHPILILSGGEPLAHPDFFTIAQHAVKKNLRVALGSNGTLITRDIAVSLKKVPVSRVGISIDFPVPELQDRFRGVHGAFQAALQGIEHVREAGLEVQINSTISKLNAHYVEDLLRLALDSGAVAFHPFMLVPTGRGKNLADEELPAEEYERILSWIYEKQLELGKRIFLKPTDAPHYKRIILQKTESLSGVHQVSNRYQDGLTHRGGNHDMNNISRGCLAGTGFCFISHTGRVQGCGYLDVEAGNIKKDSLKNIWTGSPFFKELRDLSQLKGKCGICEFKKACGGCRARAYEVTGDYLEQEPYCIYQPQKVEAGVAI